MEKPIVAAPMSFTGSAQRLWRPVTRMTSPAKVALGSVMVLVILMAWTLVLCWYLFWGILVVPWRLLRRGQRRQKHYDRMMAEVQTSRPQSPWDRR